MLLLSLLILSLNLLRISGEVSNNFSNLNRALPCGLSIAAELNASLIQLIRYVSLGYLGPHAAIIVLFGASDTASAGAVLCERIND